MVDPNYHNLSSNCDDESLAERGVRGATAASHLVYRLFLFWAAFVGALSLYGLYV